MRIFLISAVAIPLAGCALPPALAIVSYAGDAVLMVASDKTSTDHLLSMAEKKDCAMWRVIKGQPICHEWKDGKDPYEKYRDADGNQVATAGSDAGFTVGMAKDSRQDVDDQFAALGNGGKAKDGVLLAQAGNDRPVVSAADARRAAGMVQSVPLAPPPGTAGGAAVSPPAAATPAIAPAASAADTVNDGAPVTQPIPPAAIAADSKPVIAAPAAPVAPPVLVNTAPTGTPTAAGGGKPAKIAAKPTTKPATPARATAGGAADRYVVLGSFRQHDNAQRLQRDHGDIKPVVQSVTVKNKRYYRVVAGPYTAGRAADIRDDLKEKAHIDAIVARDCDARSKHRCVEIDG